MPRRRAAAAAVTALRNSTPLAITSDDEHTEGHESRAETPQEQDEEEEDAASAVEAEQEEEDPPSSPPVVQEIPRKKRLGRPPKNRPPGWDTPDRNDDASDRGTPRRGRGRGRGGFRGKPRGGPSFVTRVPIDKEGNTMEVIDDEVALAEDPEGEQKVDKLGNLLGGREYRVRVFTILGRGQRKYMLSTEPARCTGFRDSYLFFTKHLQLYKIIIDDVEKRDLIDREIIPHSYKGRAIGVVTARSVFREFGAKIIVGGKRVIDDYYTAKARESYVEGELADPHDRLPAPGEPYNKNQYVAWHGASAVYHTSGPTVPTANGKIIPGKRKVAITSANWQIEHARASSRFNSTLTSARRAVLEGVYEPHTNLMHHPAHMQPTHAKWEEVCPAPESSCPESPSKRRRLTNGTTHASTNGVIDLDMEESTSTIPTTTPASFFDPVPPVVARNFLVTDTHLLSAPLSGLGLPGPDATGVPTLADVTDEVIAELPPECRKAFDEARKLQREWRSSWGTEKSDGHRARLKIGFTGVPV